MRVRAVLGCSHYVQTGGVAHFIDVQCWLVHSRLAVQAAPSGLGAVHCFVVASQKLPSLQLVVHA